MKHDAAGVVLDTSALCRTHTSHYLQALIVWHANDFRPMIIPSVALAAAAVTGRVAAVEFDPHPFTVTALSQAIVPAVALIASTAKTPIGLDIAHAAYEARATGYPIVTDRPDLYQALAVDVDLEELP
ncbi:MAG: hypothetical protein HOQ24_17545 [Mycobacteriaceae bacterium]|nr:hypothetical protein [Mycobacteriaceae bacterium]